MTNQSVTFNIDLRTNPAAARQLENALRRVGAEGSKAGKDIDDSFKRTLKGLGAVGAAVGGWNLLTGTVGKYINNTLEAERVSAQLASRIKDTGGAAGRSLEQLSAQADKLQRATIFDDETIGGAQAMLLTFKNISGVNFDHAIESALDLSTVMGMDAADAAKLLGKALSDPEKGLGALAKAGIVFTEAEREQIKAMAEAGNVAGAQAAILDKLEGSMGTAAEAARDTLGGALQGLKNDFDNLLEGDAGGMTGTIDAVNELSRVVNDPELKSGINSIAESLFDLAAGAVQGASKFGELISEYKKFLADRGFIEGKTIAQLEARRDRAVKFRGTFRGQLFNQNGTVDKEITRLDNMIEGMRPIFSDSASIPESFFRQEPTAARAAESASPSGGTTKKKKSASTTSASASIEDLAKFFDFSGSGIGGQSFLSDNQAFGAQGFAAFEEFMPEAQRQMTEFGAGWEATLGDVAENLKNTADTGEKSFDQMSVFAEQAGRNMQDAFADFLFDPLNDGFEGMLESFANTLRRMAAEAAASKLFDALGNWGKSNSGDSGWVGALADIAASLFGGKGTANANGNAFSAGRIMPFAKGTVVNGPVVFPMAKGDFGLMGEAGPEGVLPLRRNSRGQLGVIASGGSGGTTVNVTIEKGASEDRVETTQGAGGSLDIRVMVKNMVNSGIADGSFDRSMGQAFGVRRTGMSRG